MKNCSHQLFTLGFLFSYTCVRKTECSVDISRQCVDEKWDLSTHFQERHHPINPGPTVHLLFYEEWRASGLPDMWEQLLLCMQLECNNVHVRNPTTLDGFSECTCFVLTGYVSAQSTHYVARSLCSFLFRIPSTREDLASTKLLFIPVLVFVFSGLFPFSRHCSLSVLWRDRMRVCSIQM